MFYFFKIFNTSGKRSAQLKKKHYFQKATMTVKTEVFCCTRMISENFPEGDKKKNFFIEQ